MTRRILQNRSHVDLSKTDTTILTPREAEILAYLAVGATNEQIAEKLRITPHTVRNHLYNMYGKIEAPNRLQAAFWAAKNL